MFCRIWAEPHARGAGAQQSGQHVVELGRYLEARAIHERSVLVCRELGNKLSEGDNIDNLGGVAWALGDYALALRHYQGRAATA